MREAGEAVITIDQELRIRRLREESWSARWIASVVGLPEDLVRAVMRWTGQVNHHGGDLCWYGERIVTAGEQVRCGRCGCRLAIEPCRTCRLQEHFRAKQERKNRRDAKTRREVVRGK